jgi:hypothetical protein
MNANVDWDADGEAGMTTENGEKRDYASQLNKTE